ncbi:hypothetical protein AAC387_Pa03g0708 [Persea americana]
MSSIKTGTCRGRTGKGSDLNWIVHFGRKQKYVAGFYGLTVPREEEVTAGFFGFAENLIGEEENLKG